jgi:hypothetical protein
MIDFDIPDMPEDITPSWLSAALTASGSLSTGSVVGCDMTAIGEGFGNVGRAYRIAITYDTSQSDAPRTIVAKLHSKHPQNDRYWGQPGRNTYEKVQRFYLKIAPNAGIRTPKCYLAVTNWEARRSVSLLEDLGQMRPGDQVAGATAEDAITAATDWARFNARFWENDALDSIDDLPPSMCPHPELGCGF